MPKGQSPSSKMEARYDSLNAQVERAKYDEGLLRRLRRKLKELGGKKSPNGSITTVQQRSLLKKLDKIESNMLIKDRMAERVYEDQTP